GLPHPAMLLPDDALFRGRRCSVSAFDHGELRRSDSEGTADLSFDLRGKIGVFADEHLRVLAALTETEIAVGEPGARLLDDLVLQTDIQQFAHLGDAFAVADIELRLPERRGALVLDDFDFDAGADDFLPFLDLIGAADVEAYGGVELQGAAAGGRFRVAEHDTNFFTDLVDENHARF